MLWSKQIFSSYFVSFGYVGIHHFLMRISLTKMVEKLLPKIHMWILISLMENEITNKQKEKENNIIDHFKMKI